MTQASRPLGFPLALLCSTLPVLLWLKWTVIGPERVDDLAVGLSIELAFWGVLWAGASLAERLPGWTGKVLPSVLFLPAFYFTLGLVFAYTYFFDSAVERRFSLLDTDVGGMVLFFRDVLPLRGWAILVALALSMHGGALALRRRLSRPPPRAMLAVVAGLTAVACGTSVRAPRVATPLYDIVHDYRELWLAPRIQVDGRTTPYAPPASLDRSAGGAPAVESRFRKILLFVMETMTAEKLARETAPLPASTFFVRERGRSHHHDWYFPNNQDSRTGMLDLVGSRLIPYEAYRDAAVARYQGVKQLPSLLDRLRASGYASAFAVSQTDLEPVITELPWDAIVKLDEAQVAAARGSGKLCFNPYEFEHSCEDLVLLPQVIDYLATHPRAFVFQEAIWGHASEYNDASGRSNADYYSAYLDAVLAALDARGLADETLVVVTSDHGFRDKGLQDRLDVYRIPLLFHARGFTEEHDGRLLSHLDFKDLLLSTLQPGSATVRPNDAVLIVGPTGTGMTAGLTNDRDFLLVKTRGAARLALSFKNLGADGHGEGAAHDPTAPSRLLKLFDDYHAEFDARVGAPAE